MSRVASARPGPRPAKRSPGKPPGRAGGGGTPGRFAFLRAGPLARRWIAIAVILFAVLVGLPIVAAMLGEVWALILGAVFAGFALGRATARRG